MTDRIQTMWTQGQPMVPADWDQVAVICRAAIDWGHARQAVLAEETPDVRTSENFRVRLEVLHHRRGGSGRRRQI